MNNKIKHGLSYDDVLLKPQYSDIRSRGKIDISSQLSDDLVLTLAVPFVFNEKPTFVGEVMHAGANFR